MARMGDMILDYGALTVRVEAPTYTEPVTDPETGTTTATLSGTMTVTELRLSRAHYEALEPELREKYADVIRVTDEEEAP